MGKSLIIKGADFSAQAVPFSVVWYNNYASLQGSTAISANAQAILVTLEQVASLGMSGKTVMMVKLYSAAATTIRIGSAETAAIESGTTEYVFNELSSEEYSISAGENIIQLRTSITIQGNQTIFIAGNTNLTYTIDSTDEAYSLGWVPLIELTNRVMYSSSLRVPIQFGYKTY